MAGFLRQYGMVAPLVLLSPLASADDPLYFGAPVTLTVAQASNPFAFDPSELVPLRFSRIDGQSQSQSPAYLGIDRSADQPEDVWAITRQTEFSFKLKPKWPDFSREGAFGLQLFDDPRLDIRSSLSGTNWLYSGVSPLHDGLEYSTVLRLEHDDAQIDGTAYVSSSLLGLSYGRLGSLWYGGIDVNLEQFSPDRLGSEPAEVLSFDVTTGRRFGFTGTDESSPLWMLSVQGSVDMNEWDVNDDLEASSDWYINPSLFWQQPGFRFSAQMQVPVEFETLDDKGTPDYRLRAVFEKQFK